jgi:hypothetical protein
MSLRRLSSSRHIIEVAFGPQTLGDASTLLARADEVIE